ncbi:N-acetylmuramoyl-L-alanine amidase [Streptomyces albipurpureus]|uniref:N-acetylmuramoyl-L-alanine amidase n=1 Tax=Streptomyces albipurpureus TaxID=2897419 RepID=A0ABT0UNR0_9ACTN|nr:peptidoglycan recognition family protein [Streptomyces sp. CWNU-1]MCM2389871.1 N-acetylmuramoyl-L-alanine amidase [Streptomyces sp. CWNU-1]
MDRRRLLQGAAAAAATSMLASTSRAHAANGSAADPLPDAPRQSPGTAPLSSTDYPSAQWMAAASANYTVSNRPSSYSIDFVVIHVAQETFADTVSIFQNPAKQVSAHYVVGSSDGSVAQCVRERHIGWHAGNWDYNTRSVGIEHEGWVDQPAYFTHALYESSAALTASICDRYGIPKDRARIIGHHEVPGADHTDPGPLWDWGRYIRLVNLA